jgi:predicted dehydrogenase
MKFASGITANCLTTYGFNGKNEFTAFAENGRFGLNAAYSYSGQNGWTSREDVPLSFPAIDHFAAQMDAFSRAILNEQPFEPSGTDGLRDLLAVEAIYRAIASGNMQTVAKA